MKSDHKNWWIYGSGLIVSLLLFINTAIPNENEWENISRGSTSDKNVVETGGHLVGMEFHRSRPTPSRISFFYPVANSLDISRDGWTRDSSSVFFYTLQESGIIDTIGKSPYQFDWTPSRIKFTGNALRLEANVEYNYCDSLAAFICDLDLSLPADETESFAGNITLEIQSAFRTCHTYTWRYPTKIINSGKNSLILDYDYIDTDSASVFITCAGGQNVEWDIVHSKPTKNDEMVPNLRIKGKTELVINPGESVSKTFIIGSAKKDEIENLASQPTEVFRANAEKYNIEVDNAITEFPLINSGSAKLNHTQQWSRIVRMATMHHLEDEIVPMPCPSQYNFFFTHDMLVNDLGVVYSDLESVKHDLLYIKKLTDPGVNLVHARYWKDDKYVSEYCGYDNWNLQWFVLLNGAYLRHSGDIETVKSMLPIIDDSINSILKQRGEDGLMSGHRPDWWDIGNVPGPKSYLQILTARALTEYSYILARLNMKDEDGLEAVKIASELKKDLIKLWDNDKSYLMNINKGKLDEHYYSGSLTAAWFNMLDKEHSQNLISSAERELLDQNLGIRNAMPHDFHLLEDEYVFVNSEQGAEYKYMNGAVWPQGTAWYILALINQSHADKALNALEKFLTIDGISESPNGQPSFYEFRNINPDPVEYGKVSKPTFLWTGGWFENCYYQLAGLRDNGWNLYYAPELPDKWKQVESSITVDGTLVNVSITGEGDYFKRISADGKTVYSAILSGQAEKINFELGIPEYPYLACIDAIPAKVIYQDKQKKLIIENSGITGTKTTIKIISPLKVKKIKIDGKTCKDVISNINGNVYEISASFIQKNSVSKIECSF